MSPCKRFFSTYVVGWPVTLCNRFPPLVIGLKKEISNMKGLACLDGGQAWRTKKENDNLLSMLSVSMLEQPLFPASIPRAVRNAGSSYSYDRYRYHFTDFTFPRFRVALRPEVTGG